MRSIEFTAYCVREYDVKYTAVLDEDDPIVQEWLVNNGMKFEDLAKMDFVDSRGLWDTLMDLRNDVIIELDEDFGVGDERFVDFNTFISGE